MGGGEAEWQSVHLQERCCLSATNTHHHVSIYGWDGTEASSSPMCIQKNATDYPSHVICKRVIRLDCQKNGVTSPPPKKV